MRLVNFLVDKDCDTKSRTSTCYSRLRSIKESKQDTRTELEMDMQLVNFGIVEDFMNKQNMQTTTCSISEFTDDIMSQGFVKSMRSFKVCSNNSSSADKKLNRERKDALDLLQVSPVRGNFKKMNHMKDFL